MKVTLSVQTLTAVLADTEREPEASWDNRGTPATGGILPKPEVSFS